MWGDPRDDCPICRGELGDDDPACPWCEGGWLDEDEAAAELERRLAGESDDE